MSNTKYELVHTDTKTVDGITLTRIRALVAIAAFNVTPGDLGGYIQAEVNLSAAGDAWISGDARVYGDAQVYGGARVSDNAWISDNARVYGDAQVSGNAQVYGDAQVSGNARVSDNAQVSGNASKTPIQVGGLFWQVTITDTQMRIGCQVYTLKAWARFTKAQIASMDPRAADFWAAHKDLLLGLARADGRL